MAGFMPFWGLPGAMPSPSRWRPIRAKTYQMQVPYLHAFPEKNLGIVDDDAVALAVGGGGSRAHVLTCGYLRALREVCDVNFGYISAVSAGSWATTVYCYSDKEDSVLLGKETKPETLTLSALEAGYPGDIAVKVASKDFIAVKDSFLKLFYRVSARDIWTNLLGSAILKDFGLKNCLFALDAEHVKDILKRNPHLRKIKFATIGENKPFLIINSTLLGPDKYTTGYGDAFQITPLYTGVPFYKTQRQMDYHSVKMFDRFQRHVLRRKPRPLVLTVGGGFIESYAVNAKGTNEARDQYLPLHKDEQQVMVKRFNPLSRYFTLQEAIGASSSKFASHASSLGYFDKLYPTVTYTPFFSPKMIQFTRYQSPRNLNVGDGGLIDNLGIMSLLQRQVKKIICLVNTETPLDLSYEEQSRFVKYKFDDKLATVEYQCACLDLLALFGAVEFVSQEHNLLSNHVFEKEKLDEVLAGLVENVEAGRGAVYRTELEVLPNREWNLAGGNLVDILFVYNQTSTNFIEKLPTETQAEIDKEGGKFHRFPFYKTAFQNETALSLTRQQVNLLSSHAEHVIKENVGVIQSFLDTTSSR